MTPHRCEICAPRARLCIVWKGQKGHKVHCGRPVGPGRATVCYGCRPPGTKKKRTKSGTTGPSEYERIRRAIAKAENAERWYKELVSSMTRQKDVYK